MTEEIAIAYQKRMVAAHDLQSKVASMQAAIVELATHAHNWDNQQDVDKWAWEAYHTATELLEALFRAVGVAHYG
jgi:hypothetical protein